MPRDGDVFHAELLDSALFVLAVTSAHIDHDRYSHLLEGFQAISAGLASAIQIGRDLTEVRQAHVTLAASHGTLGRRSRVVLRRLRESNCDNSKQDYAGRNAFDLGGHFRFDAR